MMSYLSIRMTMKKKQFGLFLKNHIMIKILKCRIIALLCLGQDMTIMNNQKIAV
jgi:hypothetical protein